MDKKLYNVHETREALGGISEETLRRLAKKKKIRPVHIGTRVFYSANEIDRFAKELTRVGAFKC